MYNNWFLVFDFFFVSYNLQVMGSIINLRSVYKYVTQHMCVKRKNKESHKKSTRNDYRLKKKTRRRDEH